MKYNQLLLFIVLLVGLNQVNAREWFANPEVSSRFVFDSNYRLRTNLRSADGLRVIKPKDTFGGTLSAGGTIGSMSEASDIHIRGKVNFNRFNIRNFNSTDVFLYPEAWFTVSPRDRLGISGTLFYDTTLARDIAGVGSNNQDDSETDDLLGDARKRFKKSVKPEWNHALTEKTNLNLSYEFTDVTYEDAESTGRTDYSIHSGQLSLSHQLTPKTSIFGTTSATLFSTPDINASTTYYSIQAGVQHQFSERWEAEIVGGGRYSRSESRVPVIPFIINPDGTLEDERDINSGFGSLANASLTHKYTKGSIRASIGQDIRPTGNGDLQTSNQAALAWTHQLTEQVSFKLPISALRAAGINSESSRLDRTYYQAAPTISWNLTPELSLALRYRYRYQKFDAQKESANSHNAMISASYRWQRLSVSR